MQGLKPKNHVPMLSLENCPTRIANAVSQPRLTLFLLLLALLACAPQVSAGLIRELWEGTVADSELPGWNPGDFFRFTVSYDDSDSTFIQRGLGADGIAGTADDIEIPFNNTCFGGVVCYRPAADASFNFGDFYNGEQSELRGELRRCRPQSDCSWRRGRDRSGLCNSARSPTPLSDRVRRPDSCKTPGPANIVVISRSDSPRTRKVSPIRDRDAGLYGAVALATECHAHYAQDPAAFP